MFGWSGKILRVDLTEEKIVEQVLPEKWKDLFLGGAGINAYILYKEVEPEVKPFDPENKFVVGVGPLTGTLAPASNRTIVTSKTPYFNGFGDSSFSGKFGVIMKWAGYDHIVIGGRAKKPVYLYIENEDVELRDAKHLWGVDVLKTTDILQEESPNASVTCIGPAGENLVLGAAVFGDKHKVAARGGLGAVLGSKNFKAIMSTI